MCSSQMLGHSRVREGRGAMSKCPQQLTGLAYKIMVVPLCIVVINLGMVFSTGVTERNAITAVMRGITKLWNTWCRPRMLGADGHWQQIDEVHQVRLVLAAGDQVNLVRLLR